MSRHEFEAILDECLDALREGRADVAACLALYPAHADALRPHLEAAALLTQAHAVEPREEWAASARERFLVATGERIEEALSAVPREEWAEPARERFLIASGARIEEAFEEAPSPSFFAAARVKFLMAAHRMSFGDARGGRSRGPFYGGAFRVAAALGVVVVVFMGFSTYTVATAQAALPGDWRYSIKLQTERVRLALAFSESAERDVRIDIASERAEEIEKLAERGKIIPPGVIDNLRNEAEPLLAAVEDEKITDVGDLDRIRALGERASSVLEDPQVRVEPDGEEQRAAAADTAKALTIAADIAGVNNAERPPVLTPSVPFETVEPTPTAEPTQTPESQPTPEGGAVEPPPPTLEVPTPTPERAGLNVDETPVSTEAGITWIRLAVDNFTTLIPSPQDGWNLAGISVADGPVSSPALVRLSNTDGTQLITLNPRNGNMWWFVWVNGRFDEVQVRQIRDGQTYTIDRELLRRLYGPLAEVPLYVLDHIEILPEPEPTPAAEEPAAAQ